MPCTLKAVRGWMCKFDMVVLFTPYSAEMHKSLLLRIAQTYYKGRDSSE